ncbi:MAG: ATP-binding protein, partial [Anaerolineales bacterium]|nr:ATP-binding protein [Anaerolineales bacterium]
MMNFSDLWNSFKLLGEPDHLSKEELAFLERFLSEQYQLRETKRIQYLMRASGIKRIKLLNDFDWTFNPKIPRDKIMEFLATDWLKKPCHLVLIGPA